MTIGALVKLTKTKLVDFVGIGDSNQILNGHGWDHGWQYALSQISPMYATGLLTGYENEGSGSGTGYGYARIGSTALQSMVTKVLPVTHDEIWNIGLGDLHHDPAYSEITSVSSSIGVSVQGNKAINTAHNLRYEFDYATFDTGAGSFNYAVRLEESPYTQLASGTINTNTGTNGWQLGTVTLSADETRENKYLGFRSVKNGTTALAPLAFMFQTVIDLDCIAGWRYSTLVYQGGKSLRWMAYCLQQATDSTLTHYFTRVRSRQVELSQAVNVVVMINSGLNDRNETLASVGPAAVADGDSPEAFIDNMVAVRNRIREIWTLNGWSLAELHFAPMVSHPVSTPEDSELTAYRIALSAWGAGLSDVSVIEMTDYTSHAYLLGNSYYLGGSDVSHLEQAGYEYLADKIISRVYDDAIYVPRRNGLTFPLTSSLVSSLTSPLVSR